jgi:GT2 family glycosyltransferase
VLDDDREALETLLRSMETQAVPGCALVLADRGSRRAETRAWLDRAAAQGRVVATRAPASQGVAAALNAALAVTDARWIAPVVPGDALAPHAVARILTALEARPEALFLYTDEVEIDANGRPCALVAKPAFDPVLLSGTDYIGRLAVFRRDRIAALGGASPEVEGAELYDLTLRYCAGLSAAQLLHLPYPACLRPAPPPAADAAADRTVRAAFDRPDRPAAVETIPETRARRLRFPRPETAWPRVCVVLPNRDSPDLLQTALDGLLARTDYPNLAIRIVDNGSTDPRTRALYDRRLTGSADVSVEIRPAPFNFSAMVNRGVAAAGDAHVLLFNNDVEVLHPDWLREMVECLSYDGVGVVGAKLLFPDRRIQHAGVVLGLGGGAGHWFYKEPDDLAGPMGRLRLRNAMTVVTGACMLISRPCLEAVGPFDEVRFRVAYNDVDFCARARCAGFGVVWTPFATLLHRESASRGTDRRIWRARRHGREKAALAERHGTRDFLDPCYSPWWPRRPWWPEPEPPLRVSARGELPGPRSFMGFEGA